MNESQRNEYTALLGRLSALHTKITFHRRCLLALAATLLAITCGFARHGYWPAAFSTFFGFMFTAFAVQSRSELLATILKDYLSIRRTLLWDDGD